METFRVTVIRKPKSDPCGTPVRKYADECAILFIKRNCIHQAINTYTYN